ncbi:MAG: flippase-like domain-containing protein [Deltaproteobacteria bacterium]|nr:flippase-like domain-containing protein [Deltaproteobacteria bacterium]
MNKKAIASLVLLCITAAGIGFYLKHNPGLIGYLRNISPWNMILLFLVSVTTLATNGLCLRIFAKKFSICLKWKEWLGLASVTAMGNYLTPFSGGLVARAAYLKHRYDLPYAHFLALLAAHYMIAFAVISVTGTVTLLTLTGAGSFSWPVLLFFLATLSTVLLISYVPSIAAGKQHRLLRLVQPALEGFDIVRRDGALWGKLIALTFFNIAAGGLLYFMAFASIGFAVPFTVALLIYLLTSFTILINITPGNLGVQEAAASLAAAILGAGADQGLLAALIVRAVTILSAFALGPIFSYLLSKELTKDPGRKPLNFSFTAD